MLNYYLFITVIVCLICGFGLYQIILTMKPQVNAKIQTVTTDLREINAPEKEESRKINVPDNLKSVETVKPPEVKKKEEPKSISVPVENVFERGAYSDQKDAYKI